MRFVRSHLQAIAFLMVAIAATVAIDLSANHTAHVAAKTAAIVLHDSQIAACHRGNDLRRQINARTADSETSRQVLLSFLRSARTARLDSFAVNKAQSDLQAANQYASQIKREQRVHFVPVEIVNCKQAFPSP